MNTDVQAPPSTQDQIDALTSTVRQQRTTIDALIIAAERRTADEPDSAAMATWQRNLTLQRRVAERTDRVQVAERLLRSVIDSLDTGLCILAADAVIIDTNRVWNQMLGVGGGGATNEGSFLALGRGRLGGLSGLLDQAALAVGQVLAGRTPGVSADRCVLVNGDERWWRTRVDRVVGHDAAQAVVTLTDVTRQVRASEELRAAMEHSKALALELSTEKAVLTGVISSVPHLTYWKDFAGRYHGHNAAYLAMRGVPTGVTLLGRTEGELDSVDELSGILLDIENQVLRTGLAVVDQQITVSRTDGTKRSVLMSVLPQSDASGQLGGLIGVGADVTRVSELERQLNQINRLEAIGQLAAGIAHEINTPIQFISDNTRFVAQSLTPLLALVQHVDLVCRPGPAGDPAQPAGDPARVVAQISQELGEVDVDFLVQEIPAALSESLEGLDRVAQIVRAMKDFSHPGQGRSAIDLNRAVESTVQVARNEWKYHAELALHLGADVGLVPCYEGEFKQVVLNLIVNAAHAIEACQPRADGALGRIQITTTRFADRVEVAVGDNGTGMDQATQDRIFDPFFTTKEVGKGTGQGLSMAYASIVQKHGGALRVDSAPGAGTVFTIVLPNHADPEPEAA